MCVLWAAPNDVGEAPFLIFLQPRTAAKTQMIDEIYLNDGLSFDEILLPQKSDLAAAWLKRIVNLLKKMLFFNGTLRQTFKTS